MPPSDKKRALLDVGASLITEHGYAGTSVEEICQAAGVTKGGFFHHFPTKEAFASTLLADTWRGFEDAHEGADSLDAPTALREHIHFMTGFIAGRGRLIPRLAQELGGSNPEIRTQVRGYFATWTGHLRATLDRSGIDGDLDALMEFLIAGMEGVPLATAILGGQVAEHTATHLAAYVESLLPAGGD